MSRPDDRPPPVPPGARAIDARPYGARRGVFYVDPQNRLHAVYTPADNAGVRGRRVLTHANGARYRAPAATVDEAPVRDPSGNFRFSGVKGPHLVPRWVKVGLAAEMDRAPCPYLNDLKRAPTSGALATSLPGVDGPG